MKRRLSLRFRLALQTLLVTAIVVTAFGLGAWWFAKNELTRNHDLLVAQKARLLWTQLTPRFREADFKKAALTSFEKEDHEVAVTIIWHSSDQRSAKITGPELTSSQIETFRKALPTGPDVITQALETTLPSRQGRPRSPEVGRRGSQRRPVMPQIREPSYFTLKHQETEWRYASFSSPHYTLFIGLSTEDLTANARKSALGFAVAGLGAIALATLAGWWISGRALRPLDRIITSATHMNAGQLDQKIPTHKNDCHECDQLIEVLNGMTDRLQKSFEQSTHFTADASHELKTPLSVMQNELSEALRSEEIDEATRQKINLTLHQIARLKRMTTSLLLLSQADAGELPVNHTHYNLSQDLAPLLEDACALCEASNLSYTQEIEPEVFITADRDLMHQVFQNLISNAVKHNRPNGMVQISLKKTDGKSTFQISNTTTGLDEKSKQSLFDRFYRAEASRKTEGFGLGLNIANEIAKANGTRLEIPQRKPEFITVKLGLEE